MGEVKAATNEQVDLYKQNLSCGAETVPHQVARALIARIDQEVARRERAEAALEKIRGATLPLDGTTGTKIAQWMKAVAILGGDQ